MLKKMTHICHICQESNNARVEKQKKIKQNIKEKGVNKKKG